MTDYRQPRDLAEAQAAIDADLLFMRGPKGTVVPAKVWNDTAGEAGMADYLIPPDFGAMP